MKRRHVDSSPPATWGEDMASVPGQTSPDPQTTPHLAPASVASPPGLGEPRGAPMSRATPWILGLLLFHTLRVSATLVLPFVLAILAALTLMPLVRTLERAHVARPIAAGLILATLVGGLALGMQLLIEPAAEWAKRVPEMTQELELKLRFMRKPMEEIAQAADSVERLGADGDDAGAPIAVRESTDLLSSLLVRTQTVVTTGVVTLVLLYFLLTAGDTLVRSVAGLSSEASQKARTVTTLRATEGEISRYLLTICIINGCLGVVVAFALYLLDVPNAILWGAIAGLANFIPFLGPLAVCVLLAGVAAVTFDDLQQIILVPAVFALLTSLEGLFITPSIVGRSMRLNPIIVFSGILVGSWLWGIPGALVAVPMLVVLKLSFDRTPSLMPIGRALSG